MTPPPYGDGTNSNDDDPLGGMDPMAWLESLARRQGANPDELTTQANIEIPVLPPDTKVDEPGYTPGYESAKPKPAAPPPAPAAKAPEPPKPPPPAPTPAPASAAADDPFGGMDPMAWLESLARRQGANPEELTTSANLDIPVLPPDTKIDEPGYTPGYESAKPKPAAPPPVPAAKAPEPPKPPPPAPTPAPVAAASDDPLGGMDPMAWLESLAKRQGAKADELTTQANIEIPILPPDTKVDEPGYTPFDPFSAGGVSQSARNLEKAAPPSPPTPTPAPADLTDSLAWLDQLARGQGDLGFLGESTAPDLGANDPMAWLNSLSSGADIFGGTPAAPPPAPPPISTRMSAEDALSFLDSLAVDSAPPPAPVTPAPPTDIREVDKGGLSNDPAEIQAWLLGQQAKLEEVRRLEDVEPYDPNAPATAGEIPDWMRQMITDAPAPAPTVPPLDTKIALPIPPADILPDWLMPADEAESLLEEELGIPVTPEPNVVTPPAPDKIEISAAELASFVPPEGIDDDWAEALDSEYERKLAGDDSVPEWYLEALARADAVVTETPTLDLASAASTAPSLAELELEPATPGEIPDWMSSFASEPPAVAPASDMTLEALGQGQLPDWLAAITPAETAPAAPPMPDWLRAQTGTLDPAKVAEPTPPPAPEPVIPTPPVVVEVAKPAPAPVAEPPKPAPRPMIALSAALGTARQLVAKRELTPALEHYQQLIDHATNLEEVRGDLRQLAAEYPKEPKVMRLLGDAHMRLGDLQAALETYLNALDKM